MKKKKYIKQLISITFSDRKATIDGFVIDYTENWILMKYNCVDYVIDGYILVKKQNIEQIRRHKEEKWREKVMLLKGFEPTEQEIIPMIDLETILKYLTAHFHVFQLFTKDEDVCYLGKLQSIDNQKLIIDYLTPKGKWDGQMEFVPNDISVIEFDTDYVNSLKLVLANENRF
jgi:hypothetical protein